jgi:membrane protein YqaA with SNARE-associated domain
VTLAPETLGPETRHTVQQELPPQAVARRHPPPRDSPLRRFYLRVLALADGPHAVWVMMAVSFAESSIFPLPPDPLLIPMMLARPHRAWRYAILCTLASVLGGLVGYALGALLFEAVGRQLLDLYGLQPAFDSFRTRFATWGAWIIIATGLTPIPFKLVTIASGAVGLDLGRFVLACIVARAGRFLLLAALLRRFGPAVRDVLDRYLALVALGGFALLGGGVAALWLLG